MAKKTVEVAAFKAFTSELKCNNFQYEVGKEYEHQGEVRACASGFHACENPIDVLEYYPLIGDDGKLNRFGRVIQSGEIIKEGTKSCSAKIKIECELNFSEFVKEAVKGLFAIIKKIDKKDDSKLAASGDGSNLAASGYGSKLAASGYGSNLAASGNYSNLAASGDDSKLAASGYGSKLAASGGGSNVIVSAEKDIIVKASINTLICLTYYVDDKPVKFVTGRIGEKGLKPDIWYSLDADGKFIEVTP